MKERTVIITCEITLIDKVTQDVPLFAPERIAQQLQEQLYVDNVNVVKLQQFIRDLPSQSDTEVVETP